ncbi:MAG: CmpA/NrtA family ABC transporter substrate-binding protein [Pseudanabaenaceae cyanobacterium]
MGRSVVVFLNRQKARKQLQLVRAKGLVRQRENLEKTNLALGFIPLTDCAPLAIALEKGFFAAQGLDVNLVRSPGWGAIAEDLREGNLDGAAVVTGMPLALTLGMEGRKPVPMVTALTLNRNGNAITLDRALWEQGQRTPAAIAASIREKGLPLGMVHPASMHNLLLRRWLMGLGVYPDRDVRLEVVPPPQMVANLSAGNLLGYCVGEPWNSRAVAAGIGWVAATDLDLWPGHPEKVLAVRWDWAIAHPQTHRVLVQALLQACQFCQDPENREEVLQILCRPAYLNADPTWVRPGLAGPFRTGTEQYTKDFHVFFGNNAPQRREHLWVMTEMVRWGLVSRPEDPELVLERLLATEVFHAAATALNLVVPPAPENPIVFADGTAFDPQNPWPQAILSP